ncbi:MAG TPA: hypothetical protein VFQ85_11785 [Mycobacteriales bacterium]|jgi:hypothetical protein|nr:hypothetical protein [Mycobacteriales bacterium]
MMPGRDVSRPWVWATAGVFCLVLGTRYGVAAAAGWRERGAYLRATACGDGRDCYRDVDATVVGTAVSTLRPRKGDAKLYYVSVHLPESAGLPPGDTVVELPAPDRVFPRLAGGTPVRARVWRDRVTRVELPGTGAAETGDSPLTAPVEDSAKGLFGVMSGVFALANGRRHRRGTPAGRWIRLLGAAAVAGALSVFQVAELDVYDPVPVAATYVALTLAGWGVPGVLEWRGRSRHRDGRG